MATIKKDYTINTFYEFINKNFLKTDILPHHTTAGNFSLVSDSNMNKLINILDNLKDGNKQNKFLKELYNTKCNFKNMTYEEQLLNCDTITKYINELNNKNTLIDKIIFLRNLGIDAFISYNVMESPLSDVNDPYILAFDAANVSFNKEYYLSDKFKREINGLIDYRNNLIELLNEKYPSKLDINKDICESVQFIELFLVPFMVSKVNERDIENRINKYKIGTINDALPNIDLIKTDVFTDYYRQNEIKNTEIIFTSNIDKINKDIDLNIDKIKYNKLDDKDKKYYDSGNGYWTALDHLFKMYNTDIKWKEHVDKYLEWKIINNYSGFISDEIRIYKFNFYEKFLNGQQNEKPLKERSAMFLMSLAPELIGKIYCDNHFTEQHLKQTKYMVEYILETYTECFTERCKWLVIKNDDTNNRALAKLDNLKLDYKQKIGYPEPSSYMEDYNDLFELYFKSNNRSNLLYIDVVCEEWAKIISIKKIKEQKLNEHEWHISPAMINAYYHLLKNEIVFPAAILQPPFFIHLTDKEMDTGIDIISEIENNKELAAAYIDHDRLSKKWPSLGRLTMASNFGGIGTIIGHEISHGFDDQGSKFNENGKMENWWTDRVKENYKNILHKLVKQFGEYRVQVNIDDKIETFNVNGELTLGENIADLFGLSVSVEAYKKYHKTNQIDNKVSGKTLDEGLLELFVSYACVWRYMERPEKTKHRIKTDPHSPPKFRVIGVLQNIPDAIRILELDVEEDNTISIIS